MRKAEMKNGQSVSVYLPARDIKYLRKFGYLWKCSKSKALRLILKAHVINFKHN